MKLKLSELITHCDHITNSAGDTLWFQEYEINHIVLEHDGGEPLNNFTSDLEVEILPNGDFTLDGDRMTAYISTRVDLNKPPAVPVPKCYALIADTSSIMGIYITNQPDRDQILKCINEYLRYVPEITLEDTFNTLDTTCNSELDLDSTIGYAIDELLMHNLTSLDMYDCEFTLDEFELEIGKSRT